MKTLGQIFEEDAARVDSILSEEQFRHVLEGAAPVFREASIRDAVPWRVVDAPHALKSRHVKVVDISAAEYRPSGTGGTFDRVDQSFTDLAVCRLLKNWEVPYLESITPGTGGISVLQETGQASGEKVGELENTMLVAGVGPNKGLTNATGIQTFASGGAWTTTGQAWKDFIKARGKLKTKKVPINNLAMLVHPDDEANLLQVFADTSVLQLETLQRYFPGGIHTSVDVTVGKAYVYAKIPQVLEYVVYQDLAVKPLPMVDEDPRGRTRVAGTYHTKRADGVCEITSVDT